MMIRAVVRLRGEPIHWTRAFADDQPARDHAMVYLRSVYGETVRDNMISQGRLEITTHPDELVDSQSGRILTQPREIERGREAYEMKKEMERPSKHELMIQVAGLVSTRSTCLRAHVGAIICDEELMTIRAMGYNGSARSMSNRCERDTPGDCGCVHAEANALVKAPYFEGGLVMFVTHTPCASCAKLIINSRVHTVYAFQAYRLTEGIELLRSAGIKVFVYRDKAFKNWDDIDDLEKPTIR